MYSTLRDYRFNRGVDDIRGLAVYGPDDEKLGRIGDVVFGSESGVIRYLVVETGGSLKSRRFLIPPEELEPSDIHDTAYSVSINKAQIERFPSLDEKTLEENQKFEEYEKGVSQFIGNKLFREKAHEECASGKFRG